MYDEIDMKHMRRASFWTGAFAGAFGMFWLALAIGTFMK